jgi:threonine/homoserine/homoserine lactone efflux protein
VDVTIVMGFLTILSTIGVAVLAWMLNNKSTKDSEERTHNRTRDERINSLEKKFIQAENTYVTNTQLKLAIQEAFEPYKEDNKEIKAMLKSVSAELVNISRDLAVINAIGRSNSDNRHDRSDGGES